jgi:acyl-CoA synthetase (AMP-forming)/AMP-acid ligase II
MKERARRIAGFKTKKVAGEGITASLLGGEADGVGPANAQPHCDKGCSFTRSEQPVPLASSGPAATSPGDDRVSSDEASSTDSSHSSSAVVNQSKGARRPKDEVAALIHSHDAMWSPCATKQGLAAPTLRPSEPLNDKPLWLPDVLRQVPHGCAGVKPVDSGGVEAVPSVRGDDVKAALANEGFQSLLQLIPTAAPRCGAFAVASTDESRAAASHAQLKAMLERERLSKFGIRRNDRCAVLLENGPELACAVLLCLARCTCVPINEQQTPSEIRSELQGTCCKALIVRDGADEQLVSTLVEGLDVLVLKLSPHAQTAGLFSLHVHELCAAKTFREEGHVDEPDMSDYNGPRDTALVLHTSGTSGKKKMVPYSLETLCVGAACIMDSWGLTAGDVCLNMMPLFHVGGITRNILAAILAGGGVVCAPAFDSGLFWRVIESRACQDAVTWYYAGPTMHTMILDELRHRRSKGDDLKTRLRMVANASGGLIASLAEQMQQEFGCSVLPSYGMTECMPISSPSCDYKLDHPNSSGQMCGPTVRILDDAGSALGVGEVGNICLKGAPLMEGYLGDADANAASFFPGGWFNTGDLGYLDEQGWIYLTGRSKEVINRGGEIISPFEIEEAIAGHERVKAVIAFSAPHDILQEVVGVAIVPDPAQPRVDLVGIQKYVASSLHPSKWPQVLVFMDELPKGQASKVQRIRLAQRLGLDAVSEQSSQMLRMFEARCPPRGSSLQVSIAKQAVHVDLQAVMSAIKSVQHVLGIVQCVVVSVNFKHAAACVVYVTPRTVDVKEMMSMLLPLLHDYLMPKEIIPMDSIPDDCRALPAPNFESRAQDYVAPRTRSEEIIQGIWEELLDRKQINVEADFFEVGGSSLLAGRVMAQVRRSLGVALTAAAVFSHRTIADLAKTCDAMLQSSRPEDQRAVWHPERKEGNPRWVERFTHNEHVQTTDGWVTSGFEGLSKDARLKPYSQTAPAALICQALPLVLLYPLRRILSWLFFVSIWMNLQCYYIPVADGHDLIGNHTIGNHTFGNRTLPCTGTCSCPIMGNHTLGNRTLRNDTVIPTPTCSDKSGTCSCRMIDRLSALVLALLIGRAVAYVAFPILGIVTKWLVIGRYKPGRYPLWGQYYLRWWYVDQVLMICGRGVFRHHPVLLNVYYRMLGAKIGPHVVIDPRAKLGEFDLISIGADTAIDNIRLRAFCLDNGCMLLAPQKVGAGVSLARKVYLAPGIEVPDGSAMGPNSSSYDLNPLTASEENRRYCSARFPGPNLPGLLLGYLVLLLVFVVEQLPVLLVLQQMVLYPWYIKHLRSYGDVLVWFLTPGRVGFYVALRVVRMVRACVCVCVGGGGGCVCVCVRVYVCSVVGMLLCWVCVCFV